MKILYFDCSFGAAGDMLTAAVYGLLDEAGKAEFLGKMNSLGLDDVKISVEDVKKCHIAAFKYKVDVHGEEEHQYDSHLAHDHESEHYHDHDHKSETHHHHDHESSHHDHDESDHHHTHHHASLDEVRSIIGGLNISDSAKQSALEIYDRFAKAECEVHGETPETIHFHEVGMKDSICDIVGFIVALEILSPDRIVFSPVTTGFGTVKCAHGILQVPAPATAKLLEGVKAEAGNFEGELCTPTGAVLAAFFAKEFGTCPSMTVLASANGAGGREFSDHPNVVRALLGESDARNEIASADGTGHIEASGPTDRITELSFNVDDMTGEQLSLACEILLESGARDVFMTPVFMKKGRPGQLVTVICDVEEKEKFAKLIFEHTSTIGIRERICERMVLDRRIEEREVDGNMVHVKISEGYGVRKEKVEFEDLRKITKSKML